MSAYISELYANIKHMNKEIKGLKDALEAKDALIAELVEAVSSYDAALARREHGGVAADRLVWAAKAIVAKTLPYPSEN